LILYGELSRLWPPVGAILDADGATVNGLNGDRKEERGGTGGKKEEDRRKAGRR